jgi:hypothetical protein
MGDSSKPPGKLADRLKAFQGGATAPDPKASPAKPAPGGGKLADRVAAIANVPPAGAPPPLARRAVTVRPTAPAPACAVAPDAGDGSPRPRKLDLSAFGAVAAAGPPGGPARPFSIGPRIATGPGPRRDANDTNIDTVVAAPPSVVRAPRRTSGRRPAGLTLEQLQAQAEAEAEAGTATVVPSRRAPGSGEGTIGTAARSLRPESERGPPGLGLIGLFTEDGPKPVQPPAEAPTDVRPSAPEAAPEAA